LSKENLIYEELERLFNEYSSSHSTVTKFKVSMLSEFPMFFKHYKERKYYDNLSQEYVNIKREALNKSTLGIRDYKNANYESATKLFFKAIKELTLCCLKSDPDLATAYFNCGSSLARLDRHKDAVMFIKTSLLLRDNYTDPRPTLEQVNKTREALQECELRSEDKPVTRSMKNVI
jgi:tetratricopeptide (TPR) repeat protein